MLSSGEKRYYILQESRNEVQKEWCSKKCVSVAARDQDIVPQSTQRWVFGYIALASIQVTSPGDGFLDIWHKIVNLCVSIPDKGKKTRIDESTTIFLKKENLLSYNIHAYCVKLSELQNFLYLCRVVLFQKILSKPSAPTGIFSVFIYINSIIYTTNILIIIIYINIYVSLLEGQ